MSKKLFIQSLSIAVLFLFSLSGSTSNAGDKPKKMNVNWKIAGTIVQLVDVKSPNPFFPIQDYRPHTLINLKAYGAPGPAEITFLSKSALDSPDECVECFDCAEGYGDPVYFDKNDMVAVFPDQSLLFGSIDEIEGGILCFGMSGTYFKAKMNVTGGTGRFENVSGGVLTGEGNGYPVSFDSTLAGESGKITGTIEFSDE